MSLLFSIFPVAQAQYDFSSTSTNSNLSAWSWLFGGIGLLILIIVLVIAVALYVFWFLNIYNWGTTDSASFPGGLAGKKKWFWLFFLVPLLVSIVFGWIPLINIFFMGGLGIYMLILIPYYFFGVRSKTKNTA